MQAEPTGPIHNLTAERLLALAEMVATGELSSTAAKEVLLEVINSGREPAIIAKAKNLIQVSDEGTLEQIASEVIAANPEPVSQYRAGEQKVLGFLVGQVMKRSQGQANPPKVNEILKRLLEDK